MGLRLVDDDLDVSLDLPFNASVREALCIQMQRCANGCTKPSFERRIVESLTALIDIDLKPPSTSQISYAISIAKALDIALPGEALRHKGSMIDFLSRYAPIFKERSQKPKHAFDE
ncbi:hypothetical protein [Dyella sp.]|jgi:hypothetical protein|uniref:hypothetical protein n=1 Tax=Dyella sp. TaxID=1869338 RepID=UPI002C15B093|nr:hypothetical protein [Dyella sp.]HTC28513.1 hypothetical protein [Dyella sp.]